MLIASHHTNPNHFAYDKDSVYAPKKDWDKHGDDIGVQWGDSGIVIGKESYSTAFFEAFPNSPSSFIRGEGKTVEEAEQQAFNKYEKIMGCKGHEYERRGRRDSYGYCVHCGLGQNNVFEPLEHCCVCGVPTYHANDIFKKWWCVECNKQMPAARMSNFMGFVKWQRAEG